MNDLELCQRAAETCGYTFDHSSSGFIHIYHDDGSELMESWWADDGVPDMQLILLAAYCTTWLLSDFNTHAMRRRRKKFRIVTDHHVAKIETMGALGLWESYEDDHQPHDNTTADRARAILRCVVEIGGGE